MSFSWWPRFVLILAIAVEVSRAQKGCSLKINGKEMTYTACETLTFRESQFGDDPVPVVYYHADTPGKLTFAFTVDTTKLFDKASVSRIGIGFGSVMEDTRAAMLYENSDTRETVFEEWHLASTKEYKKSYPYLKDVRPKDPILGLELVEYEISLNRWTVEFTVPSTLSLLQEGPNSFIWSMANDVVNEKANIGYHPQFGAGTLVIEKLPSGTPTNSTSEPTPAAAKCVMSSKAYQGCETLVEGFDLFWSTNGTDRVNFGLKAKAAAYASIGFGTVMPGTHSAIIYALSDGTVSAGDFFLKDRIASQVLPSTDQGLDFLTVERTSAGEFILEFSRPLEVGKLPTILSGFNDIIWAHHDDLSDSIADFKAHGVDERGTTKINIDLSAETPPSAPPTTPVATETPALNSATPTASVPSATPVVGSATPVAPSPSGPIETPTTSGCLLQYRGRQVQYETCKNLAPGFDVYFAANGTDRVLLGLKAKIDGYASIGFGPPPVTNAIVIYSLRNTTIGAGDFVVRGLQPGDVTLDGGQMLEFVTIERTGAGYLVLEVTRPLSPGSGIPSLEMGRTTITWAIDNHAISEITEINPRRATSRGQTVVEVPAISGSESPTSSPVEPTPVPVLPSASGIPEASSEPTAPPTCFLAVAGQERGFDGCMPIVDGFDVFYKLNGSRINLAMKVNASGYAGLGFGSGMIGSHSAIIYQLEDGTVGAKSFRFDDRSASAIIEDNSQDLDFLSFERTSEGYFVSEFTRPLDVSGLPSVNTSGENFIIYAKTDMVSTSIDEFITHGATEQDRGATTWRIRDSAGPTPFGSVEPSSGDTTDLGPSPSSDEGSACFPADAVVELVSGEMIKMQDLTLGDRVRTTLGSFSPVFFMTHRIHPSESHRLFEFIEITVDDPFSTESPLPIRLELSPSHYLPSGGELVAASEVRVGDTVKIVSGRSARDATVTRTRRVSKAGLYNPHTVAGDIVVNSFGVSCYTQSVHPRVAHYLLLPLRATFRILKTPLLSLSSAFDRPQAWMSRIVPSGPASFL